MFNLQNLKVFENQNIENKIDQNYLIRKYGSQLENIEKVDFSYLSIVNQFDSILFANDFAKNILKSLATPNSRVAHWQPKITEIDSRTFQGCCNLKFIDLSKNKLTRIDENLFQHLYNLEYLILSGNEINRIDLKSFQSLTKLRALHFGSNKLEEIDPNWFKGLINLEYLFMTNNEISRIDSKCFSCLNSSKIRAIILFGNKSEFKSFDWDNHYSKADKSSLFNLKILASDCVFTFEEFMNQFGNKYLQ
jgi:hypothetical protein